ncbi:MAG: hypothetical protein GF344_19510, partial [Chitinivibrionales bacterium]|nr:hypothetical protein [Chitinivibrionales bacterium]
MVNSDSNAIQRRDCTLQPATPPENLREARKHIAQLECELRSCRRELAVKEREIRTELLSKIVDNIPVMIALHEPTWTVPFLNKHALRIMDIRDDEELDDIDVIVTDPGASYSPQALWDYMMNGSQSWKEMD